MKRKYNKLVISYNAVTVFFAVIYLFVGFFYDDYECIFISLSLIAFVIINIPLFFRAKLDFFEPIFLVQFSVLIGVTLRSLFIVYSDSPRAQFLVDWKPIHEIVYYQHWLLIGLLSLVLGYMSSNVKYKKQVAKPQLNFNSSRINVSIIISIILSLYGSYVFATSVSVNFDDLETISNKRPMELESGQFTALGHIQVLAGLSEQMLYIFCLYVLASRRRFSNAEKIILLVLFVSSSITPFLNSSRSEIGLILINILILFYYRSGINLKSIGYAFGLIMVIITVMANLRALAQDNHVGRAQKENVVEAVVGSGNFLDVGRTSIIIERVPEEMEYKYGTTYLYWLVGWIPRVVWPEKPNVSLGPKIKEQIYNLQVRNHGYPPGMIAEAFINFGYPGIIIVMFLFGYLLKSFYDYMNSKIYTNDLFLLIYVSVIWRLAFGGIGLNFSQMIMQCLMAAIPMIIIYYFVSSRLIKK